MTTLAGHNGDTWLVYILISSILCLFIILTIGKILMPEMELRFDALVNLFAVIIPSLALILSIRTYAHSKSLAHYGELDNMYARLLGVAIENPHLRHVMVGEKRSADQQWQYDTYAYMVWNFVETVHDRLYDDQDSNIDLKLRETWEKVIDVEYKLFGAWFEINSGIFKDPFTVFIGKLKADGKITGADDAPPEPRQTRHWQQVPASGTAEPVPGEI